MDPVDSFPKVWAKIQFRLQSYKEVAQRSGRFTNSAWRERRNEELAKVIRKRLKEKRKKYGRGEDKKSL